MTTTVTIESIGELKTPEGKTYQMRTVSVKPEGKKAMDLVAFGPHAKAFDNFGVGAEVDIEIDPPKFDGGKPGVSHPRKKGEAIPQRQGGGFNKGQVDSRDTMLVAYMRDLYIGSRQEGYKGKELDPDEIWKMVCKWEQAAKEAVK